MTHTTPTATFALPLRVRYVECDMQSLVFNAHYLTWVDMAHADALDQLTGGYRAMVAAGADVVVVAADMRFRSPACYDDHIVVHTVVHVPGNTSLRSEFSITRDDEVLVECALTHVCVDTTDYHKQPWPDWLRAKLPQL